MKIFTILVVILLCLSNVIAADIVVTPEVPDALQNAIDNANAGDVLLLEAGKTFPNVGSLMIDTTITIRSTGDTKTLGQPRLLEIPNASGGFKRLTIDVKGDLTLIDVMLDGQLKGQIDNYANYRHIRVTDPGHTLLIDGCTFVRATARSIGLQKPDQHITIQNCLWIDNDGGSGNGRLIDCREGPHRFVKLQNNSSYFETDRIVRHMWFGKNRCPVIDTLIVDHNTFTCNLGFIQPFHFSGVRHLQFTNNLFWNGGLLASERKSKRLWKEITYIVDTVCVHPGPFAQCVLSITEVDLYNTTVAIENNNFFLDPAYQTVFDKYASISRMPSFNNELKALIADTTEAVYEEALALTNVPDPVANFLVQLDTTFYAKTDTITSEGLVKIFPFSNRTDTMRLHKQPGYAVAKPWTLLDFTYPTSSISYSKATGGFSVGDLNWFPAKKAEWIAANMPQVDVADKQLAPVKYELSQNYPNPFNPTTTISYSLSKAGQVKISVFNVMGQKIQELVNKKVAAGAHKVIWNGKDSNGMTAASGIYFYRLDAGKQVRIKKMTLLK